MSDQIFEAIESFATQYDGEDITVQVGERIREGHPLLKGREDRFKPLEVKYEVEQATAAPSEKRNAAPRGGRKPKASA